MCCWWWFLLYRGRLNTQLMVYVRSWQYRFQNQHKHMQTLGKLFKTKNADWNNTEEKHTVHLKQMLSIAKVFFGILTSCGKHRYSCSRSIKHCKFPRKVVIFDSIPKYTIVENTRPPQGGDPLFIFFIIFHWCFYFHHVSLFFPSYHNCSLLFSLFFIIFQCFCFLFFIIVHCFSLLFNCLMLFFEL